MSHVYCRSLKQKFGSKYFLHRGTGEKGVYTSIYHLKFVKHDKREGFCGQNCHKQTQIEPCRNFQELTDMTWHEIFIFDRFKSEHFTESYDLFVTCKNNFMTSVTFSVCILHSPEIEAV